MAKEDRGFASMDRAKQREIASKGGKAAHQKGTAHEWTSEEAREAGRKGGMASHRRRKEMMEPDGRRQRVVDVGDAGIDGTLRRRRHERADTVDSACGLGGPCRGRLLSSCGPGAYSPGRFSLYASSEIAYSACFAVRRKYADTSSSRGPSDGIQANFARESAGNSRCLMSTSHGNQERLHRRRLQLLRLVVRSLRVHVTLPRLRGLAGNGSDARSESGTRRQRTRASIRRRNRRRRNGCSNCCKRSTTLRARPRRSDARGAPTWRESLPTETRSIGPRRRLQPARKNLAERARVRTSRQSPSIRVRRLPGST